MNQGHTPNPGRYLPLYLTAEHPCSYLDEPRARTLFVDPTARIDNATYQILIDQGFRRSGSHVYRPACRECARCIPVRIPVDSFQPNRSQRRNWKRNADEIRAIDGPAAFKEEQFNLYRRYLAHRHADGGMADDASEESYRRFLVGPWGGETRFIELRLGSRLIGVAVTDVLTEGLSAVYTFFEPRMPERALGTFAILSQIQATQRLGLTYLYLGYWIGASRKMAYKEQFRPIEAWNGHTWRRVERPHPL